VFNYNSPITVSRGEEVFEPVNFKIKLPKGLRYYEVNDISDFAFYYDDQQVIFVKVYYENNQAILPVEFADFSIQEAEILIEEELSSDYDSDYNLYKIKLKDDRVSKIADMQKVKILLLNLKQENTEDWIKLTSQFQEL
jgi:hypothetical protein